MQTTVIDHEQWHIECMSEDGARISVLQYAGYDLLTQAPVNFKAPSTDYGEYEERPVYGYDDCFPSVSTCVHPTMNFTVRDHGQLCWLKWQVKDEANNLICRAECNEPGVSFVRRLELSRDGIDWKFNILNKSIEPLIFLLVVHPLMPVTEVKRIQLPRFKTCRREGYGKIPIADLSALDDYLINMEKGQFDMLYLGDVEEGLIRLTFRNGLKLTMEYDHSLFPTIGIWWNNCGYPDENGLRRSECAFEPIPGINSNLEEAFQDGRFLRVGANEWFEWNLRWRIS